MFKPYKLHSDNAEKYHMHILANNGGLRCTSGSVNFRLLGAYEGLRSVGILFVEYMVEVPMMASLSAFHHIKSKIFRTED